MAMVVMAAASAQVEKERYPELEKGIQEFCDQAHLVNFPDWNLKLIQLYETWRVRHGIMVLGSPGSGKTQCIRILLKAFQRINMPHKVRWKRSVVGDPQPPTHEHDSGTPHLGR